MSKLRLSLIDPSPLKQSPSEEYLSPRRKKLQRSEFDFLNFPRIKLEEKELEVTEENIRVAHQIQEIRALRRKYVYHPTEEKVSSEEGATCPRVLHASLIVLVHLSGIQWCISSLRNRSSLIS
jgi:hypothetical protein